VRAFEASSVGPRGAPILSRRCLRANRGRDGPIGRRASERARARYLPALGAHTCFRRERERRGCGREVACFSHIRSRGSYLSIAAPSFQRKVEMCEKVNHWSSLFRPFQLSVASVLFFVVGPVFSLSLTHTCTPAN
jgi:hypothetical protein